MNEKMVFDGISAEDAAAYAGPSYETLVQESIPHLDALGLSSQINSDELQQRIKENKLPVVEHTESTNPSDYVDFYAQHLI